MFTGIINNIGHIKTINKELNQDLIITIELPCQKNIQPPKIGCSIACNGICLTLVEIEFKENVSEFWLLKFQASPETVSKTNIKTWQINDKINLEFALKIGDELGGHLVSGHVDSVALVLEITAVNQDSWQFLISMPVNLTKFITPKGSVTLNGVSLTVNQVSEQNFSVNIIKHTFNHTNFSNLKIGDQINLEIDLIARYLEKLIPVNC